jgi:two-component system, NtrC family, sensor kinase
MIAPQTDAIADPQSVIVALQQRLDAGLAREAALAQELAARDAALALHKTEFNERIEYQAATVDVLATMSASPGDAQPVLDLIVRHATELCNVPSATLFEYDGELVHIRSDYRSETILAPSALAVYVQLFPMRPTRGSISCRAILDRQIIHIRDLRLDPELASFARELGHRSQVSVPLIRDDLAIGVITVGAQAAGGFSDSQIELLQTFAEQAVIAITSAETYRALQTRTADLQETLEYQTAISDVLKVISRSAFDLQPVLDTVVATAARLCSAEMAGIARREGDLFRLAGQLGFPAEITREMWRAFDFGNTVSGRAAREGRIIHVRNVADEPNYPEELIRIGKQRSSLGVPLLRGDEVIGVMALARQRVEPFTDRQIELVSTFADQAVIAIENTRLITEQREALEQQTATAEVLQVINSSPGNLAPVFEAMLEKAIRLCGGDRGVLWTIEGDRGRLAAARGLPAEFVALLRERGESGTNSPLQRVVQGEWLIEFPDTVEEFSRSGDPHAKGAVEAGVRSAIWVAIVKEGVAVGAFAIGRSVIGTFSDKQIALLQNFAAQAVIAMENARLLTEQREALEQQTATAEVLQVINSSPGNLAPVFEAMLDKAIRLCDATYGHFRTYDGEGFPLAAVCGDPSLVELHRQRMRYFVPGPHNPISRFRRGEDLIHISDAAASEAYRADPGWRELVDTGARSVLAVALRKDTVLLGYISVYRQEVRAFSDKQIALLENFAAQAVIAMENARLLDEIRQRQAELRTTFDNMGDGVAMFDADLRLAAWNRNFQQIIDLPDALLRERPRYADYMRLLAERGEFGATGIEAELRHFIEDTDKELRLERVRPDGRVIEVRRNAVPGGGFVLIYSDITERKRSEEEIRAARDAAETALRELKTAQANLIQAEKMASLGQLTAGIAHEIKNPLNFVNNFAALSVDLLGELNEAAAPGFAALSEKQRAEVDDVSAMLTSNLEKITEHGKRADGIVKAMLEHSRGSSGERRMVELNTLIDDALNLAYHGARAQDQSFNVTLERDFGDGIAPIEVSPQDITRVFLNLFANGFYAANKRARSGEDSAFMPTLKVTTRDAGEAVEIRVRDNGTGIPADIRDKLFQPFFTTKPTGEGTGLGLSITYDIVTQQHGGSIAVDSKVGEHSEFTIRLPRSP